MLAAGAGCGGGGEDEPTTEAGGPPTRVEYIARADAICLEVEMRLDRELADLIVKLGPDEPLGPRQLSEFAERTVIPTLERQLAELRRLRRPAGEEQEIAEILDAVDAGIDELRDDPARVEEADRVFATADELARDYGFEDCAEAG